MACGTIERKLTGADSPELTRLREMRLYGIAEEIPPENCLLVSPPASLYTPLCYIKLICSIHHQGKASCADWSVSGWSTDQNGETAIVKKEDKRSRWESEKGVLWSSGGRSRRRRKIAALPDASTVRFGTIKAGFLGRRYRYEHQPMTGKARGNRVGGSGTGFGFDQVTDLRKPQDDARI
ncbi:hypothetical protein CBL_13725 [Carabus blaptoides fortunei]